MRPEDIIEEWLAALKRRHVNEWTPRAAAQELITKLERDGLFITEELSEGFGEGAEECE